MNVRSASAVALGVGVLVVAVALGIATAADYDEATIFWFVVVGASALFAAAVAVEVRRRDPFSLLSLTAAFSFMAFGVGAVFYRDGVKTGAARQLDSIGRVAFVQTDMTTVVLMAAGFFALTWLGYRSGIGVGFISRIPRPATRQGGAAVTIALLLVLGWSGRALNIANGSYFHSGEAVATTNTSTIVAMLGSLPLLAVCIVGSLRLSPEKLPEWARSKMAFPLGIAIELAAALPSGGRDNVLRVLVAGVVVVAYTNGRVPWKGLVSAGLVTTLVVFPFLLSYRSEKVNFTDPVSGLERSSNVVTDQGLSTTFRLGLDTTLGRFSDAPSFATAVTQSRDQFVEGGGQTYAALVTTPIPRFIWPSKPNPARFGNDFGRDFGIVASSNSGTSISASLPGEAWLAFGFAGILIGGLVGISYRWLDTYLSGRTHDGYSRALHAVLAWPFINAQESFFSVGFVGVVKLITVGVLAIALGEALARTGVKDHENSPRVIT